MADQNNSIDQIEYSLPGSKGFPQVEPEASYWLRCPRFLSIVTLNDVIEKLGEVPEYPLNSSDRAKGELEELCNLFKARDDASRFIPLSNFKSNRLSLFLTDPQFISPPPAGAVLSRRRNGSIVKTGAELARLFESETPGLWHRHILNILLRPGRTIQDCPAQSQQSSQAPQYTILTLGPTLSPPRQALVWAALDIAIASALMAVWHYKWLATNVREKRVARRPRPIEIFSERNDLSCKLENILFDFDPCFRGDDIGDTGQLTNGPSPSPGTPRHPAYGSGHSTYSAAASYVLGSFFPSLREEFEILADNIGIARLWGGVHWRTDHEFGQQIGTTIGELIIEQLNRSGIDVCSIPREPRNQPTPPDRDELEAEAFQFAFVKCKKANNDFRSGLEQCKMSPERIEGTGGVGPQENAHG